MKNHFILLMIISCGMFITTDLSASERSIETLLKQGDKFSHRIKGDYNVAANRYWQAAAKGSEQALTKLSSLYKRPINIARELLHGGGWDTDDPKNYVQLTADIHYPHENAIITDIDCVIFASKNKIINDAVNQLIEPSFDEVAHGIYEKKFGYDWGLGGKHRAAITIDSLRKDIKIKGKNGFFVCRSRKFNGKIIALVDIENAEKHFDFEKRPADEGCIYIRDIQNPNLLIPFADYITCTFNKEIDALRDICFRLGAKKIDVFFETTDSAGRTIRTSVANKEGNMSIDEKQKSFNKYAQKLVCEWQGNQNPEQFESNWFSVKPEWKKLYEMRHSKKNALKKIQIELNIRKQHNIENEIALAIKGSIYQSYAENIKLSKDNEQIYCVEIEFPNN